MTGRPEGRSGGRLAGWLGDRLGRGDAIRLPESVRDLLGSERPLSWAQDDRDGWVVGSRDRLHLVTADGDVRSWGWESIHRADWDKETETLTVEPVQEYAAPVVRHVRRLAEPGDLVPLVRERVTATVVVQQRVQVAGKRGFRVIGRRPPTGGEVVWAFELDEGLDPDDPVVQEATARALVEARASVGL